MIKLCCDNFDMASEDVIELFKKAKATKEQVDVLLTKKNIRQRFDENQPSATVVTIADDYISPWEPRPLVFGKWQDVNPLMILLNFSEKELLAV